MTQTLEGFETQELEQIQLFCIKSWQKLIPETEYRQIGIDLYQIRSATHLITLNGEGFILFKDDTLQGQVIFIDWCRRHNIVPELRKDTDNGSESERLDGS